MASVSLGYFLRILELSEEMGVSAQDCLNRVGMKSLPKNAPKYRIPFQKADEVLNFVAEHINEPLLGIKMGRIFRIPRYSKLGNILALCDDIEQAAIVNARYAPLVHTIGSPTGIVADESGELDKICWEPNYPVEAYQKHRQISEYVMTNYVTSIDWLAWSFGKGIEVLRLAHPAMDSEDRYKEILECKVEFSAGEYSVLLKKGVAREPIPTANPAQFALMKARQEKILASYMQRDNLVFKVEQKIRETIEQEKPKQSKVASALGLSERSMRRYLAEQETSFKIIYDDIKKELALIRLSQGASISEIAHSLWYSDQAAFTRAFKKWYGVTPGKYEAKQN